MSPLGTRLKNKFQYRKYNHYWKIFKLTKDDLVIKYEKRKVNRDKLNH